MPLHDDSRITLGLLLHYSPSTRRKVTPETGLVTLSRFFLSVFNTFFEGFKITYAYSDRTRLPLNPTPALLLPYSLPYTPPSKVYAYSGGKIAQKQRHLRGCSAQPLRQIQSSEGHESAHMPA